MGGPTPAFLLARVFGLIAAAWLRLSREQLAWESSADVVSVTSLAPREKSR